MPVETEELINQLKGEFKTVVDEAFEKELPKVIGPIAAMEVKNIVDKLNFEKAVYGHDRSGLNESQKMEFCEYVKSIAFGTKVKANESLIPEVDSRGGYLVPKEVANAIVRIAASAGLIMNQAAKWNMNTDELGIPNYSGSFLEGEYLDVDAEGSVTGLSFGQRNLIVKTWQLAFVLNKALLADASVNLADWLLALAAESLANMIDKQGLVGTGKPFLGVLNDPDCTTHDLASGQNTFAEFKVLEDSSSMMADLDESLLDGAIFVMHRTCWASYRVQKDGAGGYILPQAGAVSNGVLSNITLGGGLKPAGEILGVPVYTNRHMPSITASTQASTKFLTLGNFKCFAYGDKGVMEVEEHRSGSFGGKEIARSQQRGLVMAHRHALVNALPAGFTVAKTAAS